MYIVDAMIPVWRPDIRLKKSVEKLLDQSYPLRKITLVLSIDGTWNEKEVEEWFADSDRVEFRKIPKESFNHGGTRREWAQGSDADIFLYLVQDAVPAGKRLVEKLVESLRNPAHAVAYARQIPGFGCDEIETYMRFFSYPAKSEKRTREKFEKGGVRDCFTSNVCAAYRRDWYEKIGGFEEQILLSEDSVYAAKALEAGAEIIYNANAKVVHAHQYDYATYWKRNFDIGAVHKKYESIFKKLSAEKEGIRLVRQTFFYLLQKKKVWLVPRLILLSGTKFLAYQAGKHYNRLPKKLVEEWSWDLYYWRRKTNG